MPNASNRPETASENRKLGGSRTATNETKVSAATATDPRRNAQAMPKQTPPKPPKDKNDAANATGRDHPSQSEHSAQADVARKLYEKLQNAKHDEHPPGGPPNKPKGGGFNQSFGGKHGGPKSGPPRRTQAKGG